MAEDNVLNSNQCKTCGGTLVLVGDTYYCQYCENAYKSQSVQDADGKTQMVASKTATKLSTSSGVDVFEDNIGGVIEITWNDEKYQHSGSGYIISSDGYAITNTHVVTHENGESCNRVTVRINNTETSANVVTLGDNRHGSGSGIDLAIVKLNSTPSGMKVMKFANFSNVKNGERVYVIGNSLGYGTCITSGIVSDRLRNVDGDDLLMTDCAINGGNSGGPMFNEKGEVIGTIVSGIDGAEGMNFAIPCNDVVDFIRNNAPSIRISKKASSESDSPPCPRCGSTDTDVSSGIWYCKTCEHEWEVPCPRCRKRLNSFSYGKFWCDDCAKQWDPKFM